MYSALCPAKITPQLFGELVSAAALAPSPDNNQPWAFRLSENGVEVFHRRSLALPSDVKDLFSLIAIGAAVESIVLQASTHQLSAETIVHERPFHEESGAEHLATIHLRDGGTKDELHAFLQERITNRKFYLRSHLNSTALQSLNQAVVDPESQIFWLTQPHDMIALSKIVKVADRIRFEDQRFHNEFHKVLRYNETEAAESRDGLSMKSLDLPTIAAPVFRFLRSWKRMQFANRFGMSRMFAGYAMKQVRKSSAIGLLVTHNDSDGGFLNSGRSLQRLWLTATARNIAFQPLGSISLSFLRLKSPEANPFRPEHARQLEELVEPFFSLFECDTALVPMMLFRIGRAKPPSARSYRYRTDQLIIPPSDS